MSVTLFIASPTTYSERRIDRSWTVGNLKARLEPITGIPLSNQLFTVYPSVEEYEKRDDGGQGTSIDVTREDVAVDDLHLTEFCVLRVDSTSPSTTINISDSDLANVQKFELTFDEYSKRPDTVLSTLKARQLGRYAPPREGESKEDKFKAKEEQVVGARCLVLPTTSSGSTGGTAKGSGFMGTPMLSLPPPIVPASSDSSSSGFEAMERRGTIRFVGGTHFGAGKEDGHVGGGGGGGGDWIGVELDEPVGKNDGSVPPHRYFTCRPNHGTFVRPDRVVVGDYPEIDEFASEDEDEEEV